MNPLAEAARLAWPDGRNLDRFTGILPDRSPASGSWKYGYWLGYSEDAVRQARNWMLANIEADFQVVRYQASGEYMLLTDARTGTIR